MDSRHHSASSPTSTKSPLHRGEACLTCRKRKMKCDAAKPACTPCARANRTSECEYDEGRYEAIIAKLNDEIRSLRARVHHLEAQLPHEQLQRSGLTLQPLSPSNLSHSGSSTSPSGAFQNVYGNSRGGAAGGSSPATPSSSSPFPAFAPNSSSQLHHYQATPRDSARGPPFIKTEPGSSGSFYSATPYTASHSPYPVPGTPSAGAVAAGVGMSGSGGAYFGHGSSQTQGYEPLLELASDSALPTDDSFSSASNSNLLSPTWPYHDPYTFTSSPYSSLITRPASTSPRSSGSYASPFLPSQDLAGTWLAPQLAKAGASSSLMTHPDVSPQSSDEDSFLGTPDFGNIDDANMCPGPAPVDFDAGLGLGAGGFEFGYDAELLKQYQQQQYFEQLYSPHLEPC